MSHQRKSTCLGKQPGGTSQARERLCSVTLSIVTTRKPRTTWLRYWEGRLLFHNREICHLSLDPAAARPGTHPPPRGRVPVAHPQPDTRTATGSLGPPHQLPPTETLSCGLPLPPLPHWNAD